MTAFIRSRLPIRRQVTRAASFVWKQWEQRHTAPTRLKRWIDAWWGYDVFIAHRHVDAATYAKATFEALKAKRISAFIDCEVYGTGDSLLTATPRHVRKSALLLVVGSPELLKPRTPVDWVQQEVDDYLLSHEDPKVVVVDPGGALGAAISAATPSTSSLLATLQPFLRGAPEPTDALTNPPSPAVTEAIEWQLAGRRRDQSRLWFFQVTAGVLAVLLVGVVVLAFLTLYLPSLIPPSPRLVSPLFAQRT